MKYIRRLRPVVEAAQCLCALAALILPLRLALEAWQELDDFEPLSTPLTDNLETETPSTPPPAQREYFYVWLSMANAFVYGHGTFATDAAVTPGDACLMIRAMLKDENAYVALYDQHRTDGKQERWVINPNETQATEYPIESTADVHSLQRQIQHLLKQSEQVQPIKETRQAAAPRTSIYENGVSLN